VSEENMLIGCLALSTAVGVVAALFGGIVSGIALGMAVNFSAAVGRLAFEAIVQRETPPATRGRAFAVFETRFQLGWAVAGLIPVVVNIPGQIGFLLAGVITAVALANYFAGVRSVSRRALSVRRAISSRASRSPRRAPAPRAPTPAPRPAEPAPGVPPPPGARRRRTSPARSGPRRIGRRRTARDT
jgi:MFS family permease